MKKKLSQEQELLKMKKKAIAFLKSETDYNTIASCTFVLADRHCSGEDGEERADYIRQLLWWIVQNEDKDEIKTVCSLAGGFIANQREVAANE